MQSFQADCGPIVAAMGRRARRPEFASRLRAALALRDETAAEFSQRVPPHYRLSRSTIDRTLQGRRAPNEWEVPLFAELLDVPEWFLRDGFPAETESATIEGADLASERHDEVVQLLEELAEGQRVILARLAEATRRT